MHRWLWLHRSGFLATPGLYLTWTGKDTPHTSPPARTAFLLSFPPPYYTILYRLQTVTVSQEDRINYPAWLLAATPGASRQQLGLASGL
ncbi:hypothetical protein A4R35_03880 [Thermogemmatispora tikiterensis]|uniref:Uncharacterized protein n=1 Tax=Thermogemmatispora tikiterensis TaxID=1825093 RepID=A0A328VCY5_9CHLR|nr:hypothetical protein A4R35_03880 [Thermogemmatispora tikiterensis]